MADIDRVRSVISSFDGQVLASGSKDETIRIWDLQADEPMMILRPDRPYERMSITNALGLTDAQRASLKALGAVEHKAQAPRTKQDSTNGQNQLIDQFWK